MASSADAAATASAGLPPSLATAATMAGVDLVAALHRLGGKTEVYRRMLSRFVPDLGSMAALLDMHAATGDAVSAAQVLHTLKGLAATLGAQGLAVHAAEAEKLLGGGDASADASQGLACVVGAMNAAAPTLVVLLRALENAPAPLALGSIKAFDAQNLVTGLRTLAEQLRDVDMAATDTMAGLRRYAAGTSDARLECMDDAIGALDFDRARLLCDELLTELADVHLA